MTCVHPYLVPFGRFKKCLLCGHVVETLEEEASTLFEIPPRIFEITEALWKNIAPWPSITFGMLSKHKCYISMLNGREYLIMPVFRGGVMVYYSARLLSKDRSSPKYMYPAGVKKICWTSSDTSLEDVILCEGVADAIYCSNITSSAALLGNYFHWSLDDFVLDRNLYILLDGDSVGVLSAMRLARELQKKTKKIKVVYLPEGKDPTDLSLEELKERIYG